MFVPDCKLSFFVFFLPGRFVWKTFQQTYSENTGIIVSNDKDDGPDYNPRSVSPDILVPISKRKINT